MNTITCTDCGKVIQIDKALEGQIEARVLAAERHKHEEELEKTRKEAEVKAKKIADASLEQARKEIADDLVIEKQKLEADFASREKRAKAEQTLVLQKLQEDAELAKIDNQNLRKELTTIMQVLREEKQARANAELEAQKKLAESEGRIREEARKAADEAHRLKELEKDKKIADMQKSLEEAQRKAAQGSQQNQGEVLELELENRLREAFPFDDISEVKKGQRGADIIQTVKNKQFQSCGVLLWETKNGKWQPAWVAKFKQDIRTSGASIGIIVSQETPLDFGDMKHVEGAVWVVKPMLAPALASALRATIIQVDSANKMNTGKDAKMEALYQFLVGPDFKHRVEAIVENYSMLQAELEREKRSSALRWARQEQSIRAVIDNTLRMYGDLQGITSSALPSIASLEPENDSSDNNEQTSLV